MKRLTKTDILAGKIAHYVDDEFCFDVWSVPKKFMGKAIDHLAAYEDLFERLGLDVTNPAQVDELFALVKARDEGRVVVLPCKVGDTVFEIAKGLSIYNPGLHPYVHEHIATELDVFNWARRGDIGKTVFLTRAEADAALQEGGTHETDSV